VDAQSWLGHLARVVDERKCALALVDFHAREEYRRFFQVVVVDGR
jgi:hypothetical protein